MKIKDGYLLREIAGTYIVVPVAERVIDFKGMIILNEVSAKIWEFMQTDREYSEIIDCILSDFDVDKDTAEKDLDEFLKQMNENGIIEND